MGSASARPVVSRMQPRATLAGAGGEFEVKWDAALDAPSREQPRALQACRGPLAGLAVPAGPCMALSKLVH